VVIPLSGRFSDTVKVKMTGDLAWAVVFKDADGKVLCSSPIGLIAAGAGGGSSAATGGGSLSGTVAAGAGSAPTPSATPAPPPPPDPRLVVGFTNNGRLVIVLQNTPYTGQYSKLVAADSYDLRTENLMGAAGVEFHGNNEDNLVWGSDYNDIIWLYGGNDDAQGGPGDDILIGGEGDDGLGDAQPYDGVILNDVDIIYGGPGANGMTTDDDDHLDTIYRGGGGTSQADGFDKVFDGGPDAPP